MTTKITTKTVQQRIIDEIMARLTAMTGDDGTPLFNNIKQGDPATWSALTYPGCGVDMGHEKTSGLIYPFTDKFLPIFLEFRFNNEMSVDVYDLYRYYLGKLQRRFLGTDDALTLGGLTTDVLETGSSPSIEGRNDPSPGGVLMLEVHYRHVQGDPYTLPSEYN